MVKIVETPFFQREGHVPLEIAEGGCEQPMDALPLTEEALLTAWRQFVSIRRKGSFQTVLSQWVTARLKMNCAVNPGPEDLDLPRAQAPEEEFKRSLETAFKEVRAKQRKR